MYYKKFPPAAQLSPYVECYFVWEGTTKESLDVQSPPSNFNAVVFNYSDLYEAHQNNSNKTLVPKAFACGLFTSNYHLVLKGNIGITGIVFKATALHNFFGIRMSTLVNNRMPLELLLLDKAEMLWNKIKTESEDKARVRILEEFILSYLPNAKARLSVIDEGVELIDKHNGTISVEAVADQLKISRRYLEKHFLMKVGVSPKFYSRIKRFSILSNKIAHTNKIDWQDLVFENGFHDQSHLVKEFMEFNQMNPSDYHLKHNELIRFVKH